MKFVLPINLKLLIIAHSFLLKKAENETFFSLLKRKMPITVGVFMFISGETFMLSLVEHEKGFITSGLETCSTELSMKRVLLPRGQVRSASSSSQEWKSPLPVCCPWLADTYFVQGHLMHHTNTIKQM